MTFSDCFSSYFTLLRPSCADIPQSSHVAIVELIVVVSAASGRRLLGASHTHFAQVALRTRQAAFPEHLAVRWNSSRPQSSCRLDRMVLFDEFASPASTSLRVAALAAVVLHTQPVPVGQQPAGGAVQVAVAGAAATEVPDEDVFVWTLCHRHGDHRGQRWGQRR